MSGISYLKKREFASVNDESFIHGPVENDEFVKISKVMGQQNPLSIVIENVQDHKPVTVSMKMVLCFGSNENT